MDRFKSVLTADEIAVFNLRALYSDYGYERYKMSKFEEYDLYAKNKDFLTSKNVITFTDSDGRLLALKPDVTLSIIRNTKDRPSSISKTQYNENIYRICGTTKSFREIMQVGLECMGNVGDKEVVETIILAAKSLELISDSNVLEISHIDISVGVVDNFSISDEGKKKVFSYLEMKSRDGIKSVCLGEGLSSEDAELLASLVDAYGAPGTVIPMLEKFRVNDKVSEDIDAFGALMKTLESSGYAEKVCIDFSLVGDMKYYNGIAMKGFVEGIPTSILRGGQYDNLMRRMGKKSKAIGFAVYLDELEKSSFGK